MLDAGNELLVIAATDNPKGFNRSETAPLVKKILAGEAQYLQGISRKFFDAGE